MGRIVVIDTETTWTDEVMSIGAVIADSENYQAIDSRYYLITPECRQGGMYSGVLRMNGTPKEICGNRSEIMKNLIDWLDQQGVKSIFAYNATFDKKHIPELHSYNWFDIMRLAAYRQHNKKIPADALCCKTGRLKSNYGVEPMYILLSGNYGYYEKHNGWYDAVDELKIMEMLGHPLEAYEPARI